MSTFLRLLLTVVISSTLLAFHVVEAQPNKGVLKVTASQVYQVQDPLRGVSIDCYQKDSQKLAGKFIPPNKFRLIAADIDKLKLQIAKLKFSNKKSQLKKKQKALKQLKSEQERKNNLCRFTSPVIPTVPATLQKLSRSVTSEDVRHLCEKAGFGFGVREQALVEIGVNQGIDALVSEFMQVKSEDPNMESKVADYLDGQLGMTTTQSPSGQRAALLYLWSHTNNPYSERMAKFLLSVWTVAGDVISDETFRFLFWDYNNRLRSAALSETYLPDLAVELTRDPLMLIYLNNELNVKGSPNENFARELMELFLLGPTNLDGNPNYTETTLSGQGDIAVAAKMLTGWTAKLSYTPNVATVVYKPERHQDGPHAMFVGKPYAFSGENDEDLIRGIINYHPGVKYYYSQEILKEYLTPNPPRELVEGFAEMLAAYNYNLRPAMAILLSSNAFYADQFRDTVPKDAADFAVEVVRTLHLQDATNYSELQRAVGRAGMEFNMAPSVFWYPQSVWLSPSVVLEKANIIHQLFGDSTAKKAPEPDWSVAQLLPVGAASDLDIISAVGALLGIKNLNQSQISALQAYMNRSLQYDDTYQSVPYNNQNLEIQQRKGQGVFYILANSPHFQLR